MKKTTMLLMAGSLLCGTLSYAAPSALTPAQLDQVTASGTIIETFLNGGVNQVAPTAQADIGDIAAADNGANANAGNLALADNDSNAVAGNGNTVVDVSVDTFAIGIYDNDIEDSLIASENATINYADVEVEENDDSAINVGTGNFAAADNEVEGDGVQVIGFANSTTSAVDNDNSAISFGTGTSAVDNSEVNGELKEESQGVVAGVATVTNSFNTAINETEIEIEIEDSFNVETNSLVISGQSNAQGIVLANSLGDQNIVANLVLTNAATNVPTTGDFGVGQIPAAVAISAVAQIGINDSFILVADIDTVGLPIIAPFGQ